MPFRFPACHETLDATKRRKFKLYLFESNTHRSFNIDWAKNSRCFHIKHDFPFLEYYVCFAPTSGADPENVEPGGANSNNYQTEPGGANLFFGLTYKGEQGGVRRVRPPLNPRLDI